MAFLFPVSRRTERTENCTHKYDKVRVFSSREVEYHIGWHQVPDRVRNVRRVRKIIDTPDMLLLFRDYYPVEEFYCYTKQTVVSLRFCFSSCRLRHKLDCRMYMERLWGCLDCPWSKRWKTCDRLERCGFRDAVARSVSIYFGQLYINDLEVQKRIRFGITLKDNYAGRGPQIYESPLRPQTAAYVSHKSAKMSLKFKELKYRIARHKMWCRKERIRKRKSSAEEKT